jgi:predicted Zn-dependent protease
MTDAEIARLKRVVRASPDSLQFVSLGEALRCRGELDEAYRVLRSGLRYHPNLHSAQSTLARVLAERGEAGPALELVNGLLRRDPADRSLLVLQTGLLIALDRRREAAAVLGRIPSSDPEHARLSERLQRPGSADPFATRELARRLEQAGRLTRAAAVWESIAQQDGDASASAHAQRLRQHIEQPVGLVEVTIRDERSTAAPPRPARPGHLRRLLALLRRAEQEM